VERPGELAEARRSSPRTKADAIWRSGGANGASVGAWWLVDIVGADRRGRRRRTADTWPDTRQRMATVQTETFSESPDPDD